MALSFIPEICVLGYFVSVIVVRQFILALCLITFIIICVDTNTDISRVKMLKYAAQ